MEAMQERIEEFKKIGKQCNQMGTKQKDDNQAVESDNSTELLIEELKRTGKECQQSDNNLDLDKDKNDDTQAENSADKNDDGQTLVEGQTQPSLDNIEAAATKKVEDLTRLLEGGSSDEELSFEEASEEFSKSSKSEDNFSKTESMEKNLRAEKNNSRDNVTLSMKRKGSPRETECLICHFKVAQAGNLKRHMMNKHKVLVKDEISKQKQPSIPDDNDGDEETEMEQNNPLPKEGNFVNETAESDTELNMDVEKLNAVEASPEFLCCNKDFLTLKKLKKHKSNVHGRANYAIDNDLHDSGDEKTPDMGDPDEGKVFFCDFCNLAFTAENLLNNHIESDHPDTEGDTFEESSKDDQSKSPGEPKRTSPACDEKFMRKCDYCPKIFTRSSYERNIKFHMRRAHSELEDSEKKGNVVKCKLCYKEYTGVKAKGNLRRHERIAHTDDSDALETSAHKDELDDLDVNIALRYPCNLCDLRFISNEVLDVHMNYAHGETEMEQNELLPTVANFVDEAADCDAELNMDVGKVCPEETSPEFLCCNKDFLTLKKLKKHKSNVHGTTKYVN